MFEVWIFRLLMATFVLRTTADLFDVTSVITGDVRTALSRLCTLNNVCHNKSKEEVDKDYNNIAKTYMTSCCSGCSCATTCDAVDNCCFPTAEKVNRPWQECLPISINPGQPQVSPLFYSMVTNCAPFYNTSNLPNGETYAWGDVFPSYSKSTGLIYKNITIAHCNGAMDAIKWNVIMSCQVSAAAFLSSSSFDSLFAGNTCFPWFMYNAGPMSDIRWHECFPDLKNDCTDDFTIPDEILLSKNEVIALCESNFISPYKHTVFVFKNIFCLICSSFSFATSPQGLCSVGSPFEEQSRSTTGRFAAILSWEFLESRKIPPAPQRQACRPLLLGMNDTTNCRPVLCARGRYNKPDGTCDYITEDVHTSPAVIHIRLTAANPNILNMLRSTSFIMSESNIYNNPWKLGNWKFANIMCRYSDTMLNGCFLDSLVVSLYKLDIRARSDAFYVSIKNILSKKMTMKLGNTTVVYNQAFQEQVEVIHPEGFAENIYLFKGDVVVKDFHMYVPFGLIWSIDLFGPGTTSLVIQKHDFCSIIELEDEDYVRIDDTVLFYKRTNRIFFHLEVIDIQGHKPRVCLSDTDFVEGIASTQSLIPELVKLLAITHFLVLFDTFSSN